MKILAGLSLSVLVGLIPLQSWSHGQKEPRVAIEADMAVAQAGVIKYSFQLVDTERNKVLEDSDLKISHEKKLHMLAYDPSLREFQHIHPEFDGKTWVAEVSLSVNGEYWIWLQGELESDGEEFSSSERLVIQGGQAAWPMPPILGDQRQNIDGNSRAELSQGRLVAGRSAMLNVTFSRTDGSSPELSPYLGAFAHIVVVPEDGDSLIHVHPMAGNKQNQGMIHATFPRAGDYRVWVQFMDGGILRIVPLSIRVATK